MSELTPETPGLWVVGTYEDDEDIAFIGEIGGSVCLIDNLDTLKAERIAAAHNMVLGTDMKRLEAAERKANVFLGMVAEEIGFERTDKIWQRLLALDREETR